MARTILLVTARGAGNPRRKLGKTRCGQTLADQLLLKWQLCVTDRRDGHIDPPKGTTEGNIMEETITITVAEHKKLLEAQSKLSCLEATGVDNWNGYDEAMDKYNMLNAA